MQIYQSQAGGNVDLKVYHAPGQLVQKGLAGAEEAKVQVWNGVDYQDYLKADGSTVLKLTATIKNIEVPRNGQYRLVVSASAASCTIVFEDGQL